MNKKIVLAVLITLIASVMFGQQINLSDVVQMKIYKDEKPNKNKSLITVDFELSIKEGWHINSNEPLDEYLTPTSISLSDSSKFSVVQVVYPAPVLVKLKFSDSDLSLYEGKVTIKVSLKLKNKIKEKKVKLEGKLLYQPCNDQTCLFPTAKTFSYNIDLAH